MTLDYEKRCNTCLYKDTSEDKKPCSECFDSFCGQPFPSPSKWEVKRLNERVKIDDLYSVFKQLNKRGKMKE